MKYIYFGCWLILIALGTVISLHINSEYSYIFGFVIGNISLVMLKVIDCALRKGEHSDK